MYILHGTQAAGRTPGRCGRGNGVSEEVCKQFKGMIMTIEEIEQGIVGEFSVYEDWMDKYAYLIELGSEMKGMEEKNKTEDNLIDGCQSRVWFHAELKDGLLYFTADSDAIITKGIARLLIRVFSGQRPVDIVNADVKFIDEIGLTQHLSPTRSNGLLAMLKKIRMYAIAAEAGLKQEGTVK